MTRVERATSAPRRGASSKSRHVFVITTALAVIVSGLWGCEVRRTQPGVMPSTKGGNTELLRPEAADLDRGHDAINARPGGVVAGKGGTAGKFQPSVAPRKPAAPAVVQVGPVKMSVLPEYGRVFAGRAGHLNVLLRLEGRAQEKPSAARKRPPLDLAIVIDRSGSMQGRKLSAVKRAALALLGRLRSDDRVTLISYASWYRTHTQRLALEGRGRAKLRRAIRSLHAEGNTALGPALTQALASLKNVRRKAGTQAHVMLLSDGLANTGEVRPSVLGRRTAQGFAAGVSVSTLGVGVDFNERLMVHLATQGGGRYHFIERDADITKALAKEFDGLESAVARQVVARVAPAQGVEIQRVYGYATTRTYGSTLIRVGALRPGQVRNIVIRLNLPATAGPRLELADWRLTLRDVGNDDKAVHGLASLALRTSADARVVAASLNAEVSARVAEVEAAHGLQLANSSVRAGRYDFADQQLGKNLRRLREQNTRTPSPALSRMIERQSRARRQLRSVRRARPAKRKAYLKRQGKAVYDALQ